MGYMIHRFLISSVFGNSEEYEEHTNKHSCLRRLEWLAKQDDGFTYWAEDADGNVWDADYIYDCTDCSDNGCNKCDPGRQPDLPQGWDAGDDCYSA